MSNASVSTQVTLQSQLVAVSVQDPRPDSLQTFGELTGPQREQLAHDAWHVGLRALMNAYRQAEEARLLDVGKTLRENLDAQFREHAERQTQGLAEALGRYFDPESGEVSHRLRALTSQDGSLGRLLDQHLGPRNSVLVETLVQHVGEQSPLFRRLSSTDSDGLIAILGAKLQKILQDEHQQFTKALDPLQEDGAIGRFIGRLREELRRAEDDQAKQLKVALAALDTTQEDSLLNQLRRETHQARADLLEAINPVKEGSPLAVIRTSLTELLASYAKSTKEQLEEARRANAEFQQELRESVLRIEHRRQENQRNARGGLDFEGAVADFIQRHFGGAGYTVEVTGGKVGLRPSCKVGDVVLQFPCDHAFSGCRVVVEAKHDKSYSVPEALDELRDGRANRDAGSGVFVLARSHARPGFPSFARYGQDVLVVWDHEDPSSDAYLQAALMVGVGLATRSQRSVDEGDLQALQTVEQRLVQELRRLDTVRGAAKKIRSQVETIEKEVATGEKKLSKVIEDAKKTLVALNVELREEELERDSPIVVEIDAFANEPTLGVAE